MFLARLVAAATSLFITLPFTAHAQAPPPAATEEALIRATVDTYFDGWATGDTTKVSAAMHASCHLKLVNKGEFRDINKQAYLSGFKPRPQGDTQARILTLHQTGHAASVAAQITSGPNRFTDYFNLLKINGRWYITDKVSIRQDL
ncbi:MAG TPA: nuclear transport factor 2 family protein [Hymenobacter sp.]|nr:nuclear transport factor 2 family protein [Hymenobacter sp.]